MIFPQQHLVILDMPVLALLFTFFLSISGKDLPSFINKCKLSDPTFPKCMERAIPDVMRQFKDGSTEYGLNRLDPFFVRKMDLGNSTSGSVSLHQIYENVTLFGITDIRITDFEIKLEDEDCHWTFTAVNPLLRMEAEYSLQGHVLLFPINGRGTCKNLIYELEEKHRMKCEKYRKKGKTFLRVLEYTFDMFPKKVVYDFSDIIESNKVINREILKTINENSLEVYRDVKAGFEETFAKIFKPTINSFFSRVPMEKLYIP